jgi:hypothetical protein
MGSEAGDSGESHRESMDPLRRERGERLPALRLPRAAVAPSV